MKIPTFLRPITDYKRICMSKPDTPAECLQNSCPGYNNGQCGNILTAGDMYMSEDELQKRFADIPTAVEILQKRKIFELIRKYAPNEDAGIALCEYIESDYPLNVCHFCNYNFWDYGYIPCGEFCQFCNIDYQYYPDMPLSIVSLAERGIELIPHL